MQDVLRMTLLWNLRAIFNISSKCYVAYDNYLSCDKNYVLHAFAQCVYIYVIM